MLKKTIVGIILFFSLPIMLLAEKGTYIQKKDYLDKAFSNNIPNPSVIWIKDEIQKDVEEILGHPYAKLRVKYWEKSGRTVWILDEIGKEKYITTGIIINARSQIESVKVLTFRESRGWEVKHDFFTQQFKSLTQKPNTQLSQSIDGITGATLSVNALKVQARMALYLHEKTQKTQ